MHSPREKTLVNVGMGGCDTATVSYKDVWENYENSVNENPITSDSTPFGSCDLLTSANFPQGLGNAQMFEALYGPLSAQPTIADIPGLVTSDSLFGFGSANNISGKNTLFTAPRELGSGGSWSVRLSSGLPGSNRNNQTDYVGYMAEIALTIERLKACRDRLGNGIVSTELSNGDTMYKFKMSVTHVTAMRIGDVGYVHYSPVCQEQEYSLSVSSKLYAISGISSNSMNNAIYVESVDYKGPLQGVCNSFTECDQNTGPQHRCPVSAVEYSGDSLKSMSYTVNLDLRTLTNTIGKQLVRSYYGLANVNSEKKPTSN